MPAMEISEAELSVCVIRVLLNFFWVAELLFSYSSRRTSSTSRWAFALKF